jgi:hypothetical protein
MATKAELELKVAALEYKINSRNTKVKESLVTILNDSYDEIHDHIKKFCAHTGFKYPMKKVTILVDADIDITEVRDPAAGGVDFEILEELTEITSVSLAPNSKSNSEQVLEDIKKSLRTGR